MKTALNRLTALLLALAMALSLAGLSFAAESESAPEGESAAVVTQLTHEQGAETPDESGEDALSQVSAPAEDQSQAQEIPEQPPQPEPEDPQTEAPEQSAQPSDAPSQEETSDDSAVAEEAQPEQAEESAQDALTPAEGAEEEQGQAQEEVTQPAEIWWQTGEDTYAPKVAYEYNGKERRPDYQVMSEGKQMEKQTSWQEHWYSDEACTKEAKDFVNCSTVYLRIMDGETLVAQGSYTILPAPQKLTAKSLVEKLYKSKGTFTLGVKNQQKGELSYVSSNPKVVKVDRKGKCTMVGVGKAVITVTAAAVDNYKETTGSIQVQLYKKAKKLSYSASYKKGKYYKNLLNLKLSGTTAENVVDIALSQLGYKEGRKSGQMAGNGRGVGNWTEYGRYYGMNHQPWCAMFVNWCAREAGVSYGKVPKYAAVRYYHSYFKRRGLFHAWSKVRTGAYQPKKGDIIIYANSKGGVAHHIGYVMDCTYEEGRVKITTVEGNTHDTVKKVSMDFSSKSAGKHDGHYILGMASPRY